MCTEKSLTELLGPGSGVGPSSMPLEALVSMTLNLGRFCLFFPSARAMRWACSRQEITREGRGKTRWEVERWKWEREVRHRGDSARLRATLRALLGAGLRKPERSVGPAYSDGHRPVVCSSLREMSPLCKYQTLLLSCTIHYSAKTHCILGTFSDTATRLQHTVTDSERQTTASRSTADGRANAELNHDTTSLRNVYVTPTDM